MKSNEIIKYVSFLFFIGNLNANVKIDLTYNQAPVPAIIMYKVKNVNFNGGVKFYGNVISAPQSNKLSQFKIKDKGFCWSFIMNPSRSNSNCISLGNEEGDFESDLVTIPQRQIYVRAYAQVGNRVYYSTQIEFIPNYGRPSTTKVLGIFTNVITNITTINQKGKKTYQIESGGFFINKHSLHKILSKGICMSSEANPTISNKTYYNQYSNQADFTTTIKNLTPDKSYFFRAFFITEDSTIVYGQEVVFNSKDYERTVGSNTSQLKLAPNVKTNKVLAVTKNSAVAHGIAEFNTSEISKNRFDQLGFCISKNTNPTIKDYIFKNNAKSGEFQNTITDLEPNTRYYIRSYAVINSIVYYGNEEGFLTVNSKVNTIPKVTTKVAVDISDNSSTSGGFIALPEPNTITQHGICWSPKRMPKIENKHSLVKSKNTEFITKMSELKPNTIYYVRAYVIYNESVYYGNQVSFKTLNSGNSDPTNLSSNPQITTKEIFQITKNSAVGGGFITLNPGMNMTLKGLCWSQNKMPTIEDLNTKSSSKVYDYSITMDGLNHNTKYYARAFMIVNGKTYYGNEINFVTQVDNNLLTVVPTLEIKSVSEISQNNANILATLIARTGIRITERGVYFSEQPNVGLKCQKVPSKMNSKDFSVLLERLADSTLYYVRAYAVFGGEIYLSNEISFKTLPSSSSVSNNSNKSISVSTKEISNISHNRAKGGGVIIRNTKETLVKGRGICVSDYPNPSLSNRRINALSKVSDFNSTISNLKPNTQYYVRAFAIITGDTIYGEVVRFKTIIFVPKEPLVTTNQIKNITSSSANISGRVVVEKGETVSERGICWATHSQASMSDNKANGTQLNNFNATLRNLNESTQFYARAYAIINGQIYYGNEIIFSTKAAQNQR